MTHNDILRSLRYLLNVTDGQCVEILASVGLDVPVADVSAYLKREDEPGWRECSEPVLAHFLNGMVLLKRGRDDTRPPAPIEPRITNNVVLKKLRVAFALKDEDLIAAIERSGVITVSKGELGAFLRKPDHRNYRPFGDQYLRNLLRGLA